MRFEAIRRLWERLQSGGGAALEADAHHYTESEMDFGRLVLPLLSDVEAMRRLLDELAARARALEVVLDRLPVAALVLDDEGRLLTMNRPARDLFGGEAISSRVQEIARTALQEGTESEAREVALPGSRALRLRAVPALVGDGGAEGERPSVVFLVLADRPPEVDTGAIAKSFALTRTEALVTRLVAQGATNREAADQLGISTETVRSHLSSIFRKTGVANRAALVALAFGAPFGHGPIGLPQGPALQPPGA